MNMLSNITRAPSDPKIISSGPRSVARTDQLAKCLGWFGIGLGLVELVAPRQIGRALGVDSSASRMVIRAFGAREVISGIVTLSTEKKCGLWTRVAGDALDIAALASVSDDTNPKRKNVSRALLAVLGATALDLLAASKLTVQSKRPAKLRDFSNRTGFPNGFNRPSPSRHLAGRNANTSGRTAPEGVPYYQAK